MLCTDMSGAPKPGPSGHDSPTLLSLALPAASRTLFSLAGWEHRRFSTLCAMEAFADDTSARSDGLCGPHVNHRGCIVQHRVQNTCLC